jgi:hypothetical protein
MGTVKDDADDMLAKIAAYLLVIGAMLFVGYEATLSRAPECHRVLDSYGYTDVELTGYEVVGCGNEAIHEGFIATSSSGLRVRGTVCCGLVFKNCTVRLDGSYDAR